MGRQLSKRRIQLRPRGITGFASGITGGGLFESYGLAVDAQNNVWIPNEESAKSVNGGFGSETVLSSAGQVISGATGYSAGGIAYPDAIAIDTNGTAWVADNYNASVTLLSSTGQPLSGANGYTTPQLGFPLTPSPSMQITTAGSRISEDEFPHQSLLLTAASSPATPAAMDCPSRHRHRSAWHTSWVTNYFGRQHQPASQRRQSSSPAATTTARPASGTPRASRWMGQGTSGSTRAILGSSITELAGSAARPRPGRIVSPTAGYATRCRAEIQNGFAVAIDASGNLWVTNYATNTLTGRSSGFKRPP